MADYGHRAGWSSSLPVVGRRERAPQNGRNAKRLEEPPADPDSLDQIGLAPLGEIEKRRHPGAHTLEQLGTFADLLPDGRGQERNRALRIDLAHGHEPVRLVNRQRPEQEAVDQGEDGRRRADAQGERQDGRGRVASRFREHARRVAHILEERLDEGDAAGVAARFLGLLLAAERQPGVPPRLVRLDSALDGRLRLALDVQTDLLVEVRLHAAAA